MQNESKLEAPLNANDFHPLLERAYGGNAMICASVAVKEHPINYEGTIVISTASALRTTGRIARAWRA
jgi:hypothetical protein